MSFNDLKIGHITDFDRGTGVSVFLLPEKSTAAWLLAGSAPATREVTLLDPAATVCHVDALLFSGGSAFGLRAADGVMQWLKEQKRGVETDYGVVPIVPAACIYDLSVKSNEAPTVRDGYEACDLAISNNLQTGRVGAGTGASVGKIFPDANCMTGGLGWAELENSAGVIVRAYAVVNAVGDVVDEADKIISGSVAADGHFTDSFKRLLAGDIGKPPIAKAGNNSTLIAIFVNVALDKAHLARLCKVAVSGVARAIKPVFTLFDGDAIFCCSIGNLAADELVLGAMVAEATRQAIVNAVQDTEVISAN